MNEHDAAEVSSKPKVRPVPLSDFETRIKI